MINRWPTVGMLLAATGFLGLGFGLTVPTLNALVAGYFSDTVDKAVLVLNALLGPVSYTHLDVYKRQDLEQTVFPLQRYGLAAR